MLLEKSFLVFFFLQGWHYCVHTSPPRTIIYLSIVYTLGQVAMAVSAIHDITDTDKDGTPDDMTFHMWVSVNDSFRKWSAGRRWLVLNRATWLLFSHHLSCFGRFPLTLKLFYNVWNYYLLSLNDWCECLAFASVFSFPQWLFFWSWLCHCMICPQAMSISETWYIIEDHGTNYCNLYNLIEGKNKKSG